MSVAATAAVGVAVAIGGANAVADTPGEIVGNGPLVLAAPPVTPSPSASPAAQPTPAPAPVTVPAPEPKDVAAPTPPAVAATPTPSPTPGAVDPMDDLVSSGAWQRAHDWAVARGWSEQRVTAWLEAMKARISESMTDSSRKTSGQPGTQSEQGFPSPWRGSEKSRSQFSPDRD